MATINHFISLWFMLSVVALFVASFRNDWGKLLLDMKLIFFKQKIHYSLGTLILVICISPFSIPYSLKNIYNKFKNK